MSELQKAAEQVFKDIRRDETRKRRVVTGLSEIGFAMDAGWMCEMSSRELATHALKSLGLKIGRDIDPLMAFDYYMAGRRSGAQASALDGADSLPPFMRKYLNGG